MAQTALVFQVLSSNDIKEIYGFAEQAHALAFPDETERTFQSWSARWRREALEHYLKMGWSFVARHEDGRTAGFFLGQPFLFVRGQTQTLWIELVEGDSATTKDALVDVAVRVAREKHLQRVLFSEADELAQPLARWNPSALTESIAEVKTTKG